VLEGFLPPGLIEPEGDLSRMPRLHRLDRRGSVHFGDGSNPPADWDLDRRREYLDWTEDVVRGCRGVNAEVEGRYEEVLKEARRALNAAGPVSEGGRGHSSAR